MFTVSSRYPITCLGERRSWECSENQQNCKESLDCVVCRVVASSFWFCCAKRETLKDGIEQVRDDKQFTIRSRSSTEAHTRFQLISNPLHVVAQLEETTSSKCHCTSTKQGSLRPEIVINHAVQHICHLTLRLITVAVSYASHLLPFLTDSSTNRDCNTCTTACTCFALL